MTGRNGMYWLAFSLLCVYVFEHGGNVYGLVFRGSNKNLSAFLSGSSKCDIRRRNAQMTTMMINSPKNNRNRIMAFSFYQRLAPELKESMKVSSLPVCKSSRDLNEMSDGNNYSEEEKDYQNFCDGVTNNNNANQTVDRDVDTPQRNIRWSSKVSTLKKGSNAFSFEALFPVPVYDEETALRDLYESKNECGKVQTAADGNIGLSPLTQRNIRNLTDGGSPAMLSLEALFPQPVYDEEMVRRDLFENRDKDKKLEKEQEQNRREREKPFLLIGKDAPNSTLLSCKTQHFNDIEKPCELPTPGTGASKENTKVAPEVRSTIKNVTTIVGGNNTLDSAESVKMVNRKLSRMVEDRVYGFRREFIDTDADGTDAKFSNEGVGRSGKSLKVNLDLLTNRAKKALRKGRMKKSTELYEAALKLDPEDGRAYLGLSKILSKKRDVEGARIYLQKGIVYSMDPETGAPNPFLLQALGCLEEKTGRLTEAETLFLQAVRCRPWHAASWVALAQLRTRRFRRGASSGRVCFESAERELKAAGKPQSSHVYTAWASMEYSIAGDTKRAKELYRKALEIDPRCSVAFLQLGKIEADQRNWDEAESLFEEALKFDKRNSRLLQAYAIMESQRGHSEKVTYGKSGNSRKAIDLFERALQVKPRDAGVLQAYGVYVLRLGDVDSARGLLKRATETDPKHDAAWQALGVLETRHGDPVVAREIFQKGIWACAQSCGNQSGGRRCARLWQAWGMLEGSDDVQDYDAARKCFSRALDADSRNVAAVTAWAFMEQSLGKVEDGRFVFERALKRFGTGHYSIEKSNLWRSYETMERKDGNAEAAREIFQRSVRDTMIAHDRQHGDDVMDEMLRGRRAVLRDMDDQQQTEEDDDEIEVLQWRTKPAVKNNEFGESKVWMNNGSIEGKIPTKKMKKS